MKGNSFPWGTGLLKPGGRRCYLNRVERRWKQAKNLRIAGCLTSPADLPSSPAFHPPWLLGLQPRWLLLIPKTESQRLCPYTCSRLTASFLSNHSSNVTSFDRLSVLVRAAITKVPQTGWLKLQIIIPHRSEGWEVQNQSAGLFSSWWGLSSWFSGDHLLAVSSHEEEEKASLVPSFP